MKTVKKQKKKIVVDATKASQLLNHINSSIAKGDELRSAQNFSQALVSYKVALDILTEDRFSNFRSQWFEVDAVKTSSSEVLASMSECYRSLRNIREARKSIDQSIALCGITHKSHWTLLELLHAENRYPQEIELAQSLLSKKSKTQLSDQEKGAVHFRLASLAKSGLLDMDEKAIELHHTQATRLGYQDNIATLALRFGRECLSNGETDKAITHFKCGVEESKKFEDVNYQIKALHFLGAAYLADDQETNATTVFETIVATYQKAPSSIPTDLKDVIANAASLLGMLFDDSSLANTPHDKVKSLTYYQMAAELEHPVALHNLASQEKDRNVAIALYRRAVKQRSHPEYAPESELELGTRLLISSVKGEQEEGLALLKTIAKDTDNTFALNFLGVHYIADPTTHKQAFECFEKACRLGDLFAKSNLALMIAGGMRRTKDNSLIEKSPLERELEDLKDAYVLLTEVISEADTNTISEAVLTRARTCRDQVEARQCEIIKKIEKQNQPQPTESPQPLAVDAPPTLVAPLEINVSDFCVQETRRITRLAASHQIDPEVRIAELLTEFDASLDCSYYATIINRLGVLTEKCVNNRTFLESELPRIRGLLTQITQKQTAVPFTSQQTVQVIEGISKLQLNASIKEHADCVTAFYHHALAHISEFSAQQLASLVYSTTRLDPAHPLFKTPQFIPPLLTAALSKIEKGEGDDQTRSNLLYALALFGANGRFPQPLSTLQDLFTQAQRVSITMDPKDLHQRYQALFYFKQTYSHLAIDEALLEKWKQEILRTPPEAHTSKFQLSLVSAMKSYVDQITEEELVGISPVDAVVRLANHIFLFQADGPAHSLHGAPGEPSVPKLKTHFRNAYLTCAGKQQFKDEIEKDKKSLSVPCISHDEWDKAESFKEKLELFESKFKVKFDNPWVEQVSRDYKKKEKAVKRASFFSQAKSLRPKMPSRKKAPQEEKEDAVSFNPPLT